MEEKLKLEMEVSERILKVVRIAESQEVCNSDLQGICEAEARKLIADLKKYWKVG
jgi:hypothetical protein